MVASSREQHESFAGSFGPDRQFFLAYAQIWCANFREELARSSVRTDPHAPPRFRVNGVVRNMSEFAEDLPLRVLIAHGAANRCDVW